MISFKHWTLGLALCAILAAPAVQARDERAPEIPTGYTQKAAVHTDHFMVAAANPLAAEAGKRMMARGGAPIDAAIAIQAVLTLVEPQSSGIGGGAFLLYYDGKKVQAFDGRETAPAAATDTLFQNPDGSPLARMNAIVGGRSVGAPGALRMLEAAHKEHGKLAWASLFEPAIELAEKGFAISPRLHALLAWDSYLKRDPVAAAYFYDKNLTPWPVGHVLVNKPLAATLRAIAAGGADAFYQGAIARDIAAKVATHATNPGKLTAQDIAAYRPRVREPVCVDFRRWRVCGMPPPSSGGIAIAQILGMLEIKDIRPFAPRKGEPGADAIHLFSEAGRLAFADRNRYIADPDFAPLPAQGTAGLVAHDYIATRAALIGQQSMGQAKPGSPFTAKLAWGQDDAIEQPSTSHFVVTDAQGAGLSMTTSVEDAFGARQMVDGFLLNNHLTDFSFDARDADGPVANRVEPGKRPRSAMSPTLVFDKASGKLVLAVGSPGGPAIINYVAKVLVATLDWGMDVQSAISLPNFGSRNGPTELEAGRASAAVIDALKARGHAVRLIDQNSGVQAIARDPQGGWLGGADPRREGIATGN